MRISLLQFKVDEKLLFSFHMFTRKRIRRLCIAIVYNLMDFGRLARLFNFSSWRLRASTTPTFPLRANLWLRTNFASIWNKKKRKRLNSATKNLSSIHWARDWKWNALTPKVDSWILRCGFLMPLRWALRSAKKTHKINNKFGQMQMKSRYLMFSKLWISFTFRVQLVQLTLVVICVILWLGHFCISTL